MSNKAMCGVQKPFQPSVTIAIAGESGAHSPNVRPVCWRKLSSFQNVFLHYLSCHHSMFLQLLHNLHQILSELRNCEAFVFVLVFKFVSVFVLVKNWHLYFCLVILVTWSLCFLSCQDLQAWVYFNLTYRLQSDTCVLYHQKQWPPYPRRTSKANIFVLRVGFYATVGQQPIAV